MELQILLFMESSFFWLEKCRETIYNRPCKLRRQIEVHFLSLEHCRSSIFFILLIFPSYLCSSLTHPHLAPCFILESRLLICYFEE